MTVVGFVGRPTTDGRIIDSCPDQDKVPVFTKNMSRLGLCRVTVLGDEIRADCAGADLPPSTVYTPVVSLASTKLVELGADGLVHFAVDRVYVVYESPPLVWPELLG